ncbi:peptidoglycan editing factor PgeF [Sutcliffiella halmapala]|uniref:peptidoglycan editing factor PgeF n=1 Tax=Sutcliffiella halmapala TaxID=79882 RepID=UPI0009957398|nr:peptidoglycan editing factor PgeF [Sutcliffiella halmapala]
MLEPFVQETEQILSIPSWKTLESKLVVGFSTKNGGVSEGPFTSLNMGLHVADHVDSVRQNKLILADSLNFPTSSWVGCDQVHEAKIEKVNHTSIGKGVLSYDNAIPKTDGIYTDKNDILLTLCFADCVPLYFFAPEKSLIGLAHAGWKGTVKNIGAKMVELWKEEGVAPNEVKAVIGPSISASAYVVDDYVLNQVKSVLPPSIHHVVYNEVSCGQYELDLKRVNKELLLKAGVKEENISCSSFCTSTHDTLFFSHRRDKGKTGRMMSFIGMKGVQRNE